MVNNFPAVYTILESHISNVDHFYFGQIIQRRKDGHDKHFVIKGLQFRTLAELKSMENKIKDLCDSLNIKFICTFNSDLSSIDNALLRKGRLKVKYEFGNLTPEKTLKLGTSLGIPEEELKGKSLPLCDIYNYNVQTGNKVRERKKIGFA